MGLTYDELSMFGILRKVEKLGPWSCYLRLLGLWKDHDGMGPQKIAEKVMHFFRYYVTHPPSLHRRPLGPLKHLLSLLTSRAGYQSSQEHNHYSLDPYVWLQYVTSTTRSAWTENTVRTPYSIYYANI